MYQIDRESNTTIYSQVKDLLYDMIVDGTLRPGDRVPPELELAEKLGVSRDTIRRAMASLVEDRLIVRHPGKGSFVTKSPQIKHTIMDRSECSKGSIPTVVFVSFISEDSMRFNPFHYRVLDALESVVLSGGLAVAFAVMDSQSNLRLGGDIDDIVAVVAPELYTKRDLDVLRALKAPIILLSNSAQYEDVYCVGSDNVFGGYIATRHLIESGAKAIGVFTCGASELWRGFLDRYKGYKMALEHFEIEYLEELTVTTEDKYSMSYDAANELLQETKDIDAIFAVSDIMALGILHSARDHGISIPHKLRLIGYDNQRFAWSCQPALTTVQEPAEELGRQAAQIALDIYHGIRVEEKHILVKPQLIIRDST